MTVIPLQNSRSTSMTVAPLLHCNGPTPTTTTTHVNNNNLSTSTTNTRINTSYFKQSKTQINKPIHSEIKP
jgi:hypothetical protein